MSIIPQLLEISDYVSLKLRVTITDGRIIQGILVAIDDQSNLLMTEITEFYKDELTKQLEQRSIGPMSIPRKYIVKVEINQADYDKTLTWKQSQQKISTNPI